MRPARTPPRRFAGCGARRSQQATVAHLRTGQGPFFGASPVPPGAGVLGAGLLKSTVGGALIAFSLSTEKFGLTLNLNSIAVRLVGKERTVTLKSCTALM